MILLIWPLLKWMMAKAGASFAPSHSAVSQRQDVTIVRSTAVLIDLKIASFAELSSEIADTVMST